MLTLLRKPQGQTLSEHPDLLKEWDQDRNPGHVPAGVWVESTEKLHWKCQKGHRWAASMKSRIGGSSCPGCAGRGWGDDRGGLLRGLVYGLLHHEKGSLLKADCEGSGPG